ncbi:hypothetical protein [Nesterenkonia pannonica]|uniref:hypothetical protein n=1 Tax=Nesterenkonia pannonica TaxID=1548602 RepID=UPI002164176E|nr:hypothetical protein [Nesterenkonia pannonica]
MLKHHRLTVQRAQAQNSQHPPSARDVEHLLILRIGDLPPGGDHGTPGDIPWRRAHCAKLRNSSKDAWRLGTCTTRLVSRAFRPLFLRPRARAAHSDSPRGDSEALGELTL